MARYIDADKLIESLELSIKSWSGDSNSNAQTMVLAYQDVLQRIENYITADVQEVRNGRWERSIFAEDFFRCSVCCAVWNRRFEYCPHCGAKMDGKML